jgi:tetratricopeptide (TPR) repeat protein
LEQEFRYQEAADTYQETFKYEGASGYGYYKTGMCFLRLNKATKAESFLYKAIKEDPELEEAHYELALVKDELKQWPEAIHLINKAVKLDPENSEYRHSSALMHRRAGKLDEASIIYQKLIADKYFKASTFTEYAQLLFDLCEFEEGMNVLYKAIELLPESGQLQYQLAGFLFNIKKEDEAKIYLQKALLLDPGGQSYFLSLFPWLKDNAQVQLVLKSS